VSLSHTSFVVRRRAIRAIAQIALCALVVCAGAANAAKPPAKKAAAAPTPAPLVELVRDGATPFRIETRSPARTEATFAASELVAYLAKISGATLENAGRETTPRIVIGMRGDLSAADRALLPKSAAGSDGYAIAVSGGKGRAPRIVLGADQPRGLVYGVYDLLERLGCRFTHPRLDPSDPEIIPKTADLTLPVGRWAVASPVKYRTLLWFEWRKPKRDRLDTTPEELAAQIDWAMKSRYNVFESGAIEFPPDHPLAQALQAAKRRGMMLESPGHNFDLFLPSDPKSFDEHPEWYGLVDGKRVPHVTFGSQFCWTNPGARAVFTENVVKYVRERPDLDIIELSGLDGGRFLKVCGCAECAKHSQTDNVLDMLNGVVARLAKERPGLVVETLGGYQYATEPPQTVKPDKRLRVLWADWNRGESTSYSTETYPQRPNLEAWVRAFEGRATVYQYYADYYKHSWFLGPMAEQILGDRRYIIKHKIDGVLTLLYPDGYWWRSSINAWLAGRLFYDAGADPYALLREYALAYYGPAGEPVAAYLDAWAHNVSLGVFSRTGAMGFLLGELRDQRRTYLTDAARLSEGDPVAQRRVATLIRMHRLAELIMGTDIASAQSEKLLREGDLVGARRELDAARNTLTASRATASDLASEKRGLIDPEIEKSVLARKEDAITATDRKIAAALVKQTPPAGSPAAASPSVKP
jgi:hypothetical protein